MKLLKDGLYGLIGRALVFLLLAYVVFQVGVQVGANRQAGQPTFHQEQQQTLVIRTVTGFPWVVRIFPDLKTVNLPPVTPEVELGETTIRRIVSGVVENLPALPATVTSPAQTLPADDDETMIVPSHLLHLLKSENQPTH